MTPDAVARLVVELLADPTIAALVDEQRRPAAPSHAESTLDVDGAAALLHRPATTIRQYARDGRLPGFKSGRQWVFFREDLERMLRTGRLAAL